MKSWAALAVVAALAPINALAQENAGFDAHGFHIASQDGDPRDPFGIDRAGRFHAGEGWFSAAFEYAQKPLVVELHYPSGSGFENSDPTVALDDLIGLNLSFGYALGDSFRLSVAAPVFLNSTYIDARDMKVAVLDTQQGGGMGDIRVSGLLAMKRPEQGFAGGFGFGLVPFIDLPTGNSNAFLGKGGLGLGLKLAATIEAGNLTTGGELGFGLAPGGDRWAMGNYGGGMHALGGVQLGYMLTEGFGVNAEARFAPQFTVPVDGGSPSPSEAILGLRGRTKGGFHMGVGVGKGFGGAGSSAMRVIAQVGYGKILANKWDYDLDGIFNDDDKCPREPETMNSFQDEDGCPDEGGRVFVTAYVKGQVEEYVEVTIEGSDMQGNPQSFAFETTLPDPAFTGVAAGDYTVTAKTPGFEASQAISVASGDYNLELQLTPLTPAQIKLTATDNGGIPLPRAGLSVIEGGTAYKSELLDTSGLLEFDLPPGKYVFFINAGDIGSWRRVVELSPGQYIEIAAIVGSAQAVIREDRIQLMDNVYFDTGSEIIQPRSFALLDEVAALLVSTPDIMEIEVQGHTDSEGSDTSNQALSELRAQSVRAYLMQQGVPADRLVARGYGETQPIASNETAEGRAMNRRVELVITKRMDR